MFKNAKKLAFSKCCYILFSLLGLLSMPTLQAQNATFDAEQFQITLQSTASPLRVDGLLLEEAWDKAPVVSTFWNHIPRDSGQATFPTEVRLLYDQHFLYLSAVCHDEGAKRVIQSLKRDNNDGIWESDAFAMVIDPVGQQTNGFFFAVNAGGAQSEGLLAMSANNVNLDQNWDNQWFSAVKQQAKQWVVEMAIPFNTLRYKERSTTWQINFFRNDMANNMAVTWTNYSINYSSWI